MVASEEGMHLLQSALEKFQNTIILQRFQKYLPFSLFDLDYFASIPLDLRSPIKKWQNDRKLSRNFTN